MSAPKVAKPKAWTLGIKPPCFASQADWADWIEYRQGACSPCEDCTPEYKRKAIGQLRCIRPETIFLAGEDGTIGLCADDPRFARVLLGRKVTGVKTTGKEIERTTAWARLLKIIQSRAQEDVRDAVERWLSKAGRLL